MTWHTRSELNAMARERKIPYNYELPVHELRVRLGLEGRIVKMPNGDYGKAELNEMARSKGVKGFAKMRKHELTEKLGIVLPRPPLKTNGKPKHPKPVEISNSDGTVTRFPSMSKVAQACGGTLLSRKKRKVRIS